MDENGEICYYDYSESDEVLLELSDDEYRLDTFSNGELKRLIVDTHALKERLSDASDDAFADSEKMIELKHKIDHILCERNKKKRKSLKRLKKFEHGDQGLDYCLIELYYDDSPLKTFSDDSLHDIYRYADDAVARFSDHSDTLYMDKRKMIDLNHEVKKLLCEREITKVSSKSLHILVEESVKDFPSSVKRCM